MARVKISVPASYSFTAVIPVRISDINYGNHVGNDAVLSILHEARMQFLIKHGYTELNCGGIGLIMADAAIEFKKEIFYGDALEVKLTATDFTSIGFDLYYQIEKKVNEQPVIAVLAKTGMICYNYDLKKIVQVPEQVKEALG